MFGGISILLFSCADDISNSAPSASDIRVWLSQDTPSGTFVTNIMANDEEGDPINYSILEGNSDEAFIITTTGDILVGNQNAISLDFVKEFNLIILISDGLSDSRVNVTISITEEDLRPLTEEEIDIMEYFTDIALGFELGSASDVTRKWVDTMRIYVSGETSGMLIDELEIIISEINTLVSDGFHIVRTSVESASNMHIYLGRGSDYGLLYPAAANFVESNWGLFFVNFDRSDNLVSSHMYVDTERPDNMAQRHLLREELTQSLGLARDARDYPNSIFYQPWTTVDEYADIDKSLISILYHPKMMSGLNENQARQVVESILREE